MEYQTFLFGIVATILLLFISVCGNEPLSDKCQFSEEHQSLTCRNINPQTSDFGNLITADTYLLIIKESSRLEIPSNYHSDKNFQHIRSYQLVNNGATEINSLAFNKLENLRYLNISNNQQWPAVQNNTFSGLSGLATLVLVNNSIVQLENQAFEGLSDLITLELMYNKFPIVPSFIFKPLHNLTSLFLYGNHIETFENGCFEGLNEIEVIDIIYNKIKVIKASTFSGLSKLTDLYLSFNEIETIEGELTLPNLKFLFLEGNKLKSISDDTFKSVSNLNALDLSYNEIYFVADNAFYNLKSLVHVNLMHNNETLFANIKFNDLNTPLVSM